MLRKCEMLNVKKDRGMNAGKLSLSTKMPFIPPRSIKWVPRTPGDFTKGKLKVNSLLVVALHSLETGGPSL